MTLINPSRERELLALFLRDPFLLTTSPLRPDHFLDTTNQKIFSAMRNLQDKVVSATELQRELSKRKAGVPVSYLGEIINLMPDVADPAYAKLLAGDMISLASRISASDRLQNALVKLRDPAVEYHTALGDVTTAVVAAQQDIYTMASPVAADIISEGLDARLGDPIQTGFASFDDFIRIRQGQIIGINAPYKAYKTRWIINICIGILNSGGCVAYHILEDNDAALIQKFISSLTGLHESDVQLWYDDKHCPTEFKENLRPIIEPAQQWVSDHRLQVYDVKHNVHDPRTLDSRIMSDKMLYGTDAVIIDHVNMFGDDNETLGNVYRSFVATAQRAQVAIFALSQQSNDTMKFGSNNNMLGTRGTGVAGAVVHWGFEIKFNPSKTAASVRVDKSTLDTLRSREIDPLPREGDWLKEVGLWLKIVRTGPQTKFWGLFEPTSGKLVDIRCEFPDRFGHSGSLTNFDWETK